MFGVMFGHDTVRSLLAAVDLVNTAVSPDTLRTPADLEAFVTERNFTGVRRGTPAELHEVRMVRPIVRHMLTGPPLEIVELVNRLLREARAVPQLVKHDELEWHVHAVADGAPLSTRILVEIAVAMLDVLRADENVRIRVCEAPACERLVMDLSRNRSRRFCSSACGNRVAVAAYRSRRRSGAAPQPVEV